MSPIMAIFAKNIPRLRTCAEKHPPGKHAPEETCAEKTSNKKNDREHGKTAEKD